MLLMTSLSIVAWRRTLWTSTMGLSPVTVTVSCNWPTRSSAFTDARAESGQRERHGVGSRPQIDDSILAATVGDDGADLLDEDRACRLHRHAGQYCPG
jgi:hypothetical protein